MFPLKNLARKGLTSVMSSDIHLRVFSKEIPQTLEGTNHPSLGVDSTLPSMKLSIDLSKEFQWISTH